MTQEFTRDLRLKRLEVRDGILTTSSPFVNIGTGDNVQSWAVTTPQLVDIRIGTSSVPDTLQAPVMKLSRTVNMSSAGFSGDASDYIAGLLSVISGVSTNEVQTVALMGYARSQSVITSPTGADDACGVYGVGRITDSGTGSGIGAFIAGRRDTSTAGNAVGMEVSVQNYTSTVGSYNSNGAVVCKGIWLNAIGDSDSGVGFVISNPFGQQFLYGIAFTAQVSGGKTGGITLSSIRDDSQSSTSIDIRGRHDTAAVNIQASSGIAIFQPGNTSSASIRIPAGIQQTTPVQGNMFFDGTSLRFYDGTTTRTFTWT